MVANDCITIIVGQIVLVVLKAVRAAVSGAIVIAVGTPGIKHHIVCFGFKALHVRPSA